MRSSAGILQSAMFGAAVTFLATTALAQTETVLYEFSTYVSPRGRLVQLKSGALLGTTEQGGADGVGSVYLLKERNGFWKYEQIYSFSGPDGSSPYAGLTATQSAGLFGTTRGGGANSDGTVFDLSLSGGDWKLSTIHSFDGTDGFLPESELIKDARTNTLYGTTNDASSSGCGNAFSITPTGAFTVLYTFQGFNDGCVPLSGMVFGQKAGTLFGTTNLGGAYNIGTVFELTEADNVWSKKTIYTFTGESDGGYPSAIQVDSKGNLFGDAALGKYGKGVVFELTKTGGQWREKNIHVFGKGSDGADVVGLYVDPVTNTIYGTTSEGGNYNGGTAYQLVRSGRGWTETILHSFGAPGDGIQPATSPIQDKLTGALYGTTESAGDCTCGVIYMITLPGHAKS